MGWREVEAVELKAFEVERTAPAPLTRDDGSAGAGAFRRAALGMTGAWERWQGEATPKKKGPGNQRRNSG